MKAPAMTGQEFARAVDHAETARQEWQAASDTLTAAMRDYLAASAAITPATAGRQAEHDALTAAHDLVTAAREAERAAWDAYGVAVDAIRTPASAQPEQPIQFGQPAKFVRRIEDDSACPLTGRVLGWEDDERVIVAWGDLAYSADPWDGARVENMDELTVDASTALAEHTAAACDAITAASHA